MTYEQIESIVQDKISLEPVYTISFKMRSQIKGLFIHTPDYKELSRKNLWRIVSESNIAAYKKTNDRTLARIFSGSEFTRLEPAS